jgi:hypothetical protein
MDAQQAFTHFVQKALTPEKAERFTALAATKTGQKKILHSLDGRFESTIRSAPVRAGGYDRIWDSPCYVFYPRLGFGAEFAKVRDAYDRLSAEDGWLILLRDGSTGIYRPEARWDAERLIQA